MPAYEYVHVVGFGETSLVGNVYFSNYVAWQGHCRESFLAEHAREVLGPLSRREMAFLTRSCSCEWNGAWGFEGLDRVLVRMRLAAFRGGRMTLEFTYSAEGKPDEAIARGSQEVDCKVQREGRWVPAPFPPALVRALIPFADTQELERALEDALEFQDGR